MERSISLKSVVVLSLFVITIPSAVLAQMVCPRPDTIWCATDEIVEVAVCFNEQSPIDAFGFDLVYDPTRLSYVAMRPSGVTNDWLYLDAQDYSGYVRIGGIDTEPIVAGVADTLCYIVLKTNADATGVIPLSVMNCVDDLQCGCPDPGVVVRTEALSWGRLKSMYK